MALADAIKEQVSAGGVVRRNQIAALLDDLRGDNPAEHDTLVAALRDANLSSAALTRALRAEYPALALRPRAVDDFRRNSMATVLG